MFWIKEYIQTLEINELKKRNKELLRELRDVQYDLSKLDAILR